MFATLGYSGYMFFAFFCEVDTDAVFGQGWRARRGATTGVLVLTVQKIVKLLQAQFLDNGVDVPVVARLVIVVPKTVEVMQLLVDVGLSSSWTRLLTCRCCASGVWSCF